MMVCDSAMLADEVAGSSSFREVDGRPGAPRALRQAMLRGLRGRCPACGEGRLFARFVKPVDACAVCGESYTAQRADDFPPYIVILLLGHILIPIVIVVDRAFAPALWLYMTFGSAIIAALAVSLLQPVKGAVIAYQWALWMHGFAPKDIESPDQEILIAHLGNDMSTWVWIGAEAGPRSWVAQDIEVIHENHSLGGSRSAPIGTPRN